MLAAFWASSGLTLAVSLNRPRLPPLGRGGGVRPSRGRSLPVVNLYDGHKFKQGELPFVLPLHFLWGYRALGGIEIPVLALLGGVYSESAAN